jgi:hypothetical protein
MPGLVVTFANAVACSHGGPATPLPPLSRVTVMGVGVVTFSHTYAVSGCGLPAASGGPPCVSGKFTQGALRVTSMGMPLAIVPAASTCIPNATPLIVLPTGQQRVIAS